MIGAEYVEKVLYDAGVRHVFGYPGSMMLRIMDTIYKKGRISFHQMFHEQACSFAASGYARTSCELGAVIATSGPGGINALAGVADAYLDSIPLLLITGQYNSSNVLSGCGARLNGFQDLNIAEVAKPISKYSVMVKRQEDIVYELEKAISIATTGRKGPVVVDIPMDYQYLEMQTKNPRHYEEIKETLNDYVIEEVYELIKASKRPLFLLGGGVRQSGSIDTLHKIIGRIDVPVITTMNGIDCGLPFYGFSGIYGNKYANIAVYNADLIIALGTRLGNHQVGKKNTDYTNAKIVHCDIDDNELGRVFDNELKIKCDLGEFLDKLSEEIKSESFTYKNSKWVKWLDEIKKVYNEESGLLSPISVVREICKKEKYIVTADVGQNEAWTAQGIGNSGKNRFLCSSGYGSMGFSLPAAIGASYADNKAVLAFTGDGGFQMNMQELEYLKLHRNNVNIIVFNNNTLGMMREVQKAHYDSYFCGSNIDEFQCPNLEKLADCYNLEYAKIEQTQDICYAQKLIDIDEPCLIEVMVDMDYPSRNKYDDLDEIKASREDFANAD